MKKFLTNVLAVLMIICVGFAFVGCDDETPVTPETPPAETPVTPPAETPVEVVTVNLNQTYEINLIDLGGSIKLKLYEDGKAFITEGGGGALEGMATYSYQNNKYVVTLNFMGGMGNVPMVLTIELNETQTGITGNAVVMDAIETQQFESLSLIKLTDIEFADGIYSQEYNSAGQTSNLNVLYKTNDIVYEIEPGSAPNSEILDKVFRYEIFETLGELIVLKDSYGDYHYIDAGAQIQSGSRKYFKSSSGYYSYDLADSISILGLKSSKTLTAKYYTYKYDSNSHIWETEVLSKTAMLNLASTGKGEVYKRSGYATLIESEGKQWTGEWTLVKGYIIVDLVDFETGNRNTILISTTDVPSSADSTYFAMTYSWGISQPAYEICAWGTDSVEYFDQLLK